MRIHSSSLTLIPASLNRQQVGKQSSAQNKDEKKETLATTGSHDSDHPLFPPYPPEEIKPILDIAGLNLTTTGRENAFLPRDSKTLRALTAYSQELNKPLLDHRNRVAQRIDLYV